MACAFRGQPGSFFFDSVAVPFFSVWSATASPPIQPGGGIIAIGFDANEVAEYVTGEVLTGAPSTAAFSREVVISDINRDRLLMSAVQ